MALVAYATKSSDADAKWQVVVSVADAELPDAAELIRPFLNDDDEYVRRRSLMAYALFAPREDEEIAIQNLAATFEYTRIAALHVLHAIDSPHLVSALEALENDPSEHVRHNVRKLREKRQNKVVNPSGGSGGFEINGAWPPPGYHQRSATDDMSNAWQIASINFRDDDGSLPSVEFDQLKPESVGRIYQYIRERSHCVSELPTVWDDKEQSDVPLMTLDNPCAWLHEGRIDSFHCCFGRISNGATSIPDLGIFVFKDCVQIDFRMGREWNPKNVDAFFRLLADLKALAPEARIKSAESEGLMDEASFLQALCLYIGEDGRTKR